MGKVVSHHHILGERGVIKFHEYCNQHNPYLIWREETRSDFGIDGEIELTQKTPTGKLEATGKILKVQIKSTRGGYIFKKNGEDFDFKASTKDVDYWLSHDIGVVLIIYDETKKQLYAKKITELILTQSKKTIPISFSRESDLIDFDTPIFELKELQDFVPRINFACKESILMNIAKISTSPKSVFVFDTREKDPKLLYDKINKSEHNSFIFKEGRLFSLENLYLNPNFKNVILDKSSEKRLWEDVLKGNEMYCRELIHKALSEYLYRMKILYNRKKNIYYFSILHPLKERKEFWTTKRGTENPRTVAKKYKYGKIDFFRHFGFRTQLENIDGCFYFVISPSYFFSEDGVKPITNREFLFKFNYYIKTKEFNNQNLNHLRFIFDFLSKRKGQIHLRPDLIVGNFEECDCEFSIPLDYRKGVSPEIDNEELQMALF